MIKLLSMLGQRLNNGLLMHLLVTDNLNFILEKLANQIGPN